MRIEPSFFENLNGSQNCLQAVLMMVLTSLKDGTTWDEVMQLSDGKEGQQSWMVSSVLGVAHLVPGTIFHSYGDYHKIAEKGQEYLKSVWSSEHYEYNIIHSSEGFLQEQAAAQKVLNHRMFNQIVSENLLEELLVNNLVVALVDYGKLYGQEGSSGHFVLVYADQGNSFLIHDPGLPGRKAESINKEVFKMAFKGDLLAVPKGKIPFGSDIGPNEKCFCTSGKKYKKCGFLNIQEHQQMMAKK